MLLPLLNISTGNASLPVIYWEKKLKINLQKVKQSTLDSRHTNSLTMHLLLSSSMRKLRNAKITEKVGFAKVSQEPMLKRYLFKIRVSFQTCFFNWKSNQVLQWLDLRITWLVSINLFMDQNLKSLPEDAFKNMISIWPEFTKPLDHSLLRKMLKTKHNKIYKENLAKCLNWDLEIMLLSDHQRLFLLDLQDLEDLPNLW